MRFSSRAVCFIFSFCIVFLVSGNAQIQNNNTISGIVFDQTGRQPVAQIYVELMNEVYSTLKRVKTDGSGRYYFSGLSSGNFKVKVLTTGTNFEEQTQEATIINFGAPGSRPSSDNIYLDFYMKLDPRKIKLGTNGVSGVIFVQEVPQNARKLYEKGVIDLDNKKPEGLDYLLKAIEIFPIYYDALDRLGNEYIKRKEYDKAILHLAKAIDVNQRSFTSFYALGFACYHLNHLPEAIEAMRAANVINPQSINAKLWYGRLLRINGNFQLSEKTLRQAEELAKDSPVADIHWELALIYNKTNRFKEAADELETFLKIQPDSRDAKQIKELITQLRKKN